MGQKHKVRESKEHAPLEPVPDSLADGDTKFARALGSGEFHTRNKGVQNLALWLQSLEQVNDRDLQKLWKAIFYCFWHSDKEKVQRDLAQRLAGIFSKVQNEVALQYFRAFLTTMLREWGRIDKLRLDKFMMLVRCFFTELFSCIASHKWEKAYIMPYAKALLEDAFHADDATCTVGFSLHVADVYVDEWAAVAAQNPNAAIPHQACVKLLAPFVVTLQRTRQLVLLQRVRGSVFERMLNVLKCESDAEVSPWSRCSRRKLADVLSQAGTEEGVRTRNRGALYDLAQAFEQGARKRSRHSGNSASPATSPDGAVADKHRAVERQSATHRRDAAHRQPEADRQSDVAPKAAAAAPAAAAEQSASAAAELAAVVTVPGSERASDPVAAAEEQADASVTAAAAAMVTGDADAPLLDTVVSDLVSESLEAAKKGKLAHAANAAATCRSASAGTNNAIDARLGVAAGTGVIKKQRKREKRAAAAVRSAELASNGVVHKDESLIARESGDNDATAGAPPGARDAVPGGSTGANAADAQPAANGAADASALVEVKKLKKKKKKKQKHKAPTDESAAAGAPSSPRLAGAAAGSGTDATALLSKAMLAVQAQVSSPKRRITFDLERNVVHQIGKPLPPAELRTPPGAKPRGSVLKKVSSLPQPREADGASARKRLSFGGVPSAKIASSGAFWTP